MKAPLPADEGARLAALREYRILDTPREAAYDDITLLAARQCAAPIAVITLVDRDRLWFKSRVGLDAEATPRDAAFCAHAILGPDDVLVVPDGRADPRFADNPLVTGVPGVRFYAGAPLVTRDGHALGTLCVFDLVPRTLKPEQVAALRALRRQVVNELELRRYAAEQAETRAGMEALREREVLLSAIMDHFPGLVSAKDLRGVVILANRRFEVLDERGPAHFLGKNVHELFPKDVAEALWANDLAVQGVGSHIECEETVDHRDGASRTYWTAKFPLFRDGVVFATCAISTDITERKRTEAALQESEERLRQIAENIREVFWMSTAGLEQILYVSPAYEEVWGRSRESLYASPRSFAEAIHPEDRPRIERALATIHEAGGPYDVEYRILRPDGQVRWIHDRAFPVRDRAGRLVRIVGLAEHVSERKRAEQERERLLAGERAARHETEALAEANAALTARLDLQGVLETLLDCLQRLVPYDSANVMLVEDGSRIVVRALRGYEALADAARTRVFAFDIADMPHFRRLFTTRKSLVVRDSHDEPTWQRVPGTEHVRSWMGIPLVAAGEVIGLYSVDKVEPGFFTAAHVRLAETLAPQAAVAIRNAQLYARVERSAAELHEQVAERERAERLVEESERRFRALIENSSDGIAVFGEDGRFSYASPATQSITGHAPAALVGNAFEEFVHAEDLAHVEAFFARIVRDPAARDTVQFRYEHGGGSWRWMEAAGVNRLADPVVRGIVTNFRDITEGKRAEVALRESEKRYRQIVETVGEGIWQIDAESRTTFVTQRMAEMLGYTVAEMHGASMFAFMDVEGQALAAENVERRARGIKEQHDFKFRRKDGQDLWALVSADAIFDSAGRYAGALGLITDITERRRTQEALRTLSRQLLGAHEEERRRIARELHDQIGQVLTAVKLNLEGVARQTTLEAALERVPRAIETIDQAIGQVRSLSLDLRPSLLDDLGLPAALRWYVDRQTRDAGIEGQVAADGVVERLPPEVEIACFRVAQEAVTNVLRHARAKSVRVELRRAGAELELCVRDDGAGFDPGDAQASGACMGLSGMQERVSLAGGRLEITSAPGAGAQVVARFPIPAPGAIP